MVAILNPWRYAVPAKPTPHIFRGGTKLPPFSSRRLRPPPSLAPAIEVFILEPKMRIKAVGKDCVLGIREVTDAAFDDVL
jgi:hypothetical protein